jgi:hypothetical protein
MTILGSRLLDAGSYSWNGVVGQGDGPSCSGNGAVG